jgi:hypothetical protein
MVQHVQANVQHYGIIALAATRVASQRLLHENIIDQKQFNKYGN